MSTISYSNPFDDPPEPVPEPLPSSPSNPDAPGGDTPSTVPIPDTTTPSDEITSSTLSIGTIPPLPPLAASSGTGNGIPTVSFVRVSYFTWSGLIGQPVAGPADTPCDILQICAPVCFKVVSWVVQQIGAPPTCPSADTGSDNEVLFSKALTAIKPGRMPDGTRMYTRAGTYTYILQVPPSSFDALALAADDDQGNQEGMEVWLPSDFVKYLLGPVPPVSGMSNILTPSPTNPGTTLGQMLM